MMICRAPSLQAPCAEPFAVPQNFPRDLTALASPTPQRRRVEHRYERPDTLTAARAVR